MLSVVVRRWINFLWPIKFNPCVYLERPAHSAFGEIERSIFIFKMASCDCGPSARLCSCQNGNNRLPRLRTEDHKEFVAAAVVFKFKICPLHNGTKAEFSAHYPPSLVPANNSFRA